MTKNKKVEFTEKDCQKMLKDFDVKSEEELEQKLLNDWSDVICGICGKPLDIFEAIQCDDLLVHRHCK